MRREEQHCGRLAAACAAVLMACGAGAALAEEKVAPPPPPPAQAPTPDWTDSIKHPAQWISFGADARLRHEYINNAFSLNQDSPDHEWNVERLRLRAWSTITPVKNLDFNVRMAFEGRHWWEPESRPEWPATDVFFDNLNVKVTSPFGVPVTLTAGRQDIIFGDGWLVLDGTPLDGSRSIYFDAVRGTVDLKDCQTKVDVVFLNNSADPNAWLPTFHTTNIPVIEQNEIGAIAYVSNQSIKDTKLDGYFIYKHDSAYLANGDSGDIFTVGSRAEHAFNANWKAQAEGAYQFGNRNGETLRAGGVNSRLTYFFNDQWKDRVWLAYEFLSGDDPSTSTTEAFDPLWGRWPQWSELIVYNYAAETRIAEVTNLHRGTLGWQADPTSRLNLLFTYNLLFADENTFRGRPGFSNGGDFRGQLILGQLRYKFTEHISGHLLGEYFLPGNYYPDSRNDPAAFLRAEIVFAL